MLEGQHDRFLERVRSSSEAVLAVAAWLNRGGYDLEIPGLNFAPTAAESKNYVDNGDIVIVERRIVEVKQLGVEFTGPHDWPFKEVFVSNKATVDRKINKNVTYISLNSSMTVAAIITNETKTKWYVVESVAKNTGNKELFMACPKGLVKFKRIVK